MTGCNDTREVNLDWPNMCIGCGIDQGLKRYETIVKLHTYAAKAEFYDRASFYLCPSCTKKATAEQRSLRARGVITLVIVLAIGAMFALVVNLGMHDNARTLRMLVFIGFSGLLTSQVESIWLFTKRKAFNSYYDFGVSGYYAEPQFIFRNKIYAELFRSVNPLQPSIHTNLFRITARPAGLLKIFGYSSHAAFAATVLLSIMGAFNVFTALSLLFWFLFAYAAVWWYRRFHVDYFISS